MASTFLNDDPEAVAMLCRLLRGRERYDEALAMGAAAIARAPSSLAVRMAVRSALSRGVPIFHLPMLMDAARDLADARAIEDPVTRNAGP